MKTAKEIREMLDEASTSNRGCYVVFEGLSYGQRVVNVKVRKGVLCINVLGHDWIPVPDKCLFYVG